MAPTEHLAWFEDNIAWFQELTEETLSVDVPNCPGWSVENVVTHLAFGLGLGYPFGLRAPPDAAEADVWRLVPWPAEIPAGLDAIDAFSEHMNNCLEVFAETDPDTPCWTYAGPGVAGFWFRRAAIETTLHRMDVAEALGRIEELAEDRTIDAISETVDFALPFAGQISGTPEGAVAIRVLDTPHDWTMGAGQQKAAITGDGIAILNALWGRGTERVAVSGDRAVAGSWLSVVERAFAGR